MQRTAIRRTHYMVDWRLQGALIAHGVAYGLIVLLALSAGIFGPLLWSFEGVDGASADGEASIVLLYMHDRFWWTAGGCLLLVVAGAIRFSHRIAGPMVRFKRNLRMLAAGELPSRLQTRRADFLKREVECLNAAVAGLGARLDAVRHAQVAVRRRLSDCIATTFDESVELDQLVAACQELEQAVLAFRHVDPGDESPARAAAAPEPVTQGAGA